MTYLQLAQPQLDVALRGGGAEKGGFGPRRRPGRLKRFALGGAEGEDRFGPRRRPGRLKRFALGARKEKTVSDLAAAPDGRKRGGWKRAAVSPSRTSR